MISQESIDATISQAEELSRVLQEIGRDLKNVPWGLTASPGTISDGEEIAQKIWPKPPMNPEDAIDFHSLGTKRQELLTTRQDALDASSGQRKERRRLDEELHKIQVLLGKSEQLRPRILDKLEDLKERIRQTGPNGMRRQEQYKALIGELAQEKDELSRRLKGYTKVHHGAHKEYFDEQHRPVSAEMVRRIQEEENQVDQKINSLKSRMALETRNLAQAKSVYHQTKEKLQVLDQRTESWLLARDRKSQLREAAHQVYLNVRQGWIQWRSVLGRITELDKSHRCFLSALVTRLSLPPLPASAYQEWENELQQIDLGLTGIHDLWARIGSNHENVTDETARCLTVVKAINENIDMLSDELDGLKRKALKLSSEDSEARAKTRDDVFRLVKKSEHLLDTGRKAAAGLNRAAAELEDLDLSRRQAEKQQTAALAQGRKRSWLVLLELKKRRQVVGSLVAQLARGRKQIEALDQSCPKEVSSEPTCREVFSNAYLAYDNCSTFLKQELTSLNDLLRRIRTNLAGQNSGLPDDRMKKWPLAAKALHREAKIINHVREVTYQSRSLYAFLSPVNWRMAKQQSDLDARRKLAELQGDLKLTEAQAEEHISDLINEIETLRQETASQTELEQMLTDKECELGRLNEKLHFLYVMMASQSASAAQAGTSFSRFGPTPPLIPGIWRKFKPGSWPNMLGPSQSVTKTITQAAGVGILATGIMMSQPQSTFWEGYDSDLNRGTTSQAAVSVSPEIEAPQKPEKVVALISAPDDRSRVARVSRQAPHKAGSKGGKRLAARSSHREKPAVDPDPTAFRADIMRQAVKSSGLKPGDFVSAMKALNCQSEPLGRIETAALAERIIRFHENFPKVFYGFLNRPDFAAAENLIALAGVPESPEEGCFWDRLYTEFIQMNFSPREALLGVMSHRKEVARRQKEKRGETRFEGETKPIRVLETLSAQQFGDLLGPYINEHHRRFLKSKRQAASSNEGDYGRRLALDIYCTAKAFNVPVTTMLIIAHHETNFANILGDHNRSASPFQIFRPTKKLILAAMSKSGMKVPSGSIDLRHTPTLATYMAAYHISTLMKKDGKGCNMDDVACRYNGQRSYVGLVKGKRDVLVTYLSERGVFQTQLARKTTPGSKSSSQES
ncbi:MAG: hypothetical protein HQK56_05980 [Deltaproteobacteria bacterium]|nr:hypothetical protein [Deltaproteobacteria bacterium]